MTACNCTGACRRPPFTCNGQPPAANLGGFVTPTEFVAELAKLVVDLPLTLYASTAPSLDPFDRWLGHLDPPPLWFGIDYGAPLDDDPEDWP